MTSSGIVDPSDNVKRIIPGFFTLRFLVAVPTTVKKNFLDKLTHVKINIHLKINTGVESEFSMNAISLN